MGRLRRSLVQKLLRAADSPFFELPAGWHVLSRYRTAELFLKHPAKPGVVYSDNRLYRELLQEYPEVKLQPLRVNSSQPSLARRFVGQQQAYMQQLQQQQRLQAQQQQQQVPGSSQLEPPGGSSSSSSADVTETAFRQTEARADIKRELQAAGSDTGAGGFIELLQEQEEAVLQAALKKLSAQQAEAKGG